MHKASSLRCIHGCIRGRCGISQSFYNTVLGGMDCCGCAPRGTIVTLLAIASKSRTRGARSRSLYPSLLRPPSHSVCLALLLPRPPAPADLFPRSHTQTGKDFSVGFGRERVFENSCMVSAFPSRSP